MSRRSRFLPVYTGLVIAYLFVPIVVMILFGFNDPRGRFNFAWQGFTLQWYRELFDIPELTTALKNSLLVAGLSTLIATVLGTMVALALSRYRMRGRSALNVFVFLPMATPEIVLGVSLLSLFVTLGVARGFVTIVIAHILFSVSYVVVTVRARLAGLDHSLEDAAQDLGATPWTTFWTVTFPLIFPGVLAAGLLAFVLSIDDYVITSFNAGGTVTFPLWVFGASRIGVPPQVNVMGTLIFLIGVVYVIVSVVRGRERTGSVGAGALAAKTAKG
ncbi:MAG TPA: ABC transporter permease [Actinomycetota bacterium]|nr:ABC transporter permease [Actinomycetota bacterium]